MVFKVTVQPSLPFQDPDFSTAWNDLTMDEQLKLHGQKEPIDQLDSRATENSHLIKQKEPIPNDYLNMAFSRRRRRRTKSYNKFSDRYNTNSGPSDERTHFSSPIRSQAIANDHSPPPFHLLASLFLDGRQKAERKVIVYLNPNDEDFAYPDGKVTFRSRWVQGNDGSLKEHSWVFKDVGIDTIFDKMFISGGENRAEILEEHDEDAMVAAMRATGLGVEGDANEEKSNLGQILVIVQRVVLGTKWQHKQYHSKHQEDDEAEDVDMAGVKNEITHTTGLEHTGTRSSRPIRVVSYEPYVKDEKPYATFQFFYRSQQTLQKFGFPGFPRSSKFPARGRRHIDNTFANVTPLSIAHPLRALSKRKGRSFEENIKEGTFSEVEKKYKSNAAHRQLAALKVNSNCLLNLKHPPSNTSTLSSIKSATTSPRKRHVQALETSHHHDEQNLRSENSSIRPNGFTAEQRPQAALSMSSLPKSTESSANILTSDILVYCSPPSSTQGGSTSFATKHLKPEAKEGSLKPSSLVLCTTGTKAAAELTKISCSEYRGSGQTSDADDELDESDIDPLIGNKENTDPDRLNRDSVAPSLEKDDQGLHTKLQAMLLIQSKTRRAQEGINDEYNSESSATSPLNILETKMKRSTSTLGLSLGTAEDADDEDDATKEIRSPVEKVGQLLLHNGVKRTKLGLLK